MICYRNSEDNKTSVGQTWWPGWTSLVAQTVRRLPTMRETQIQSLGWEDPLEKEMATHSSTLPGKSHGQRSVVG